MFFHSLGGTKTLGFPSATMITVDKVIHEANELEAVARAVTPRESVGRVKFHLFLNSLQEEDYAALAELDGRGKVTYLYRHYALFLAGRMIDP